MKLSIIIPALNEADAIARCLQSLPNDDAIEVIVADGGSDDATVSIAQAHARVVMSDKGRSKQMNAGAQQASGDVLLFLHADTTLPTDAVERIRQCIAAGAGWGRFDVRLSGKGLAFRIIERMMNWRSCLTSVATGDQAIFVRREWFDQVKGFPDIPLMEDIALSKILRRKQRAACIHQPVVTSSRRWRQNGVARTVWLMWKLRLLYFLGAPAQRLEKMYR